MYSPLSHSSTDATDQVIPNGDHRRLTYLVIAVGIVAMLALSLQDLQYTTAQWLDGVIYVCVIFFAGEWLLRVIQAARLGKLRSYLLSFSGLIDLPSALAIPVAQLAGAGARTASLLAVLWLLKPVPQIAGLRQLRRVVVRESGPLLSVLVLFLIVLFLAAVVEHLIERNEQPATFGSIPAALWWAVVTLTTTGYGDAIPVTPAGRLVAAMLMISGLGVFGLWTGILANGFAAENRRHNSIQTWESLGKVPFFATLGPATLADVASTLRRIDLRARTTVLRRGDTGDCMYFVAAGAVEVELPSKRVELGVGSFFGELALLGNHTRTANVVTSKPSTLLVLDIADFRALMARHPELAKAIDDEATRRASENASRA
jgi:voltage-gated potassium channel